VNGLFEVLLQVGIVVFPKAADLFLVELSQLDELLLVLLL
jgi:hypothetical protein